MATRGAKPRGPSASVPGAELVRPLCHEIGNLLAGMRLAAHVLGGERDVPDRKVLARDQQRMVAHAGALLALVRPLISPESVERSPVRTPDLLSAVAYGVEDVMPPSVGVAVPKGRGLPDVRVDADVVHHALLALTLSAVEASGPETRVRLRTSRQARRLVVTLTDAGSPVEPVRRGHVPRGRALLVAVVDAALRASGGRALSVEVARGSKIEVSLPIVGASRG